MNAATDPHNVTLRRGVRDSDAELAKTFPAPRTVRALQDQLRRVGVVGPGDAMLAGRFDAATEQAVRRLQWFAGNVPGWLSAGGTYLTRSPTPMAIDGAVGPRTWALLDTMTRDRLTVTGRLAAVNFAMLTNTYPGIGFVTLVPALGQVGLADSEFAATIARMNDKAERLGIYIFVNQLFRLEGATVSGAVVAPAGFSAHKLGRAVDLQLGTHWRTGLGNPAPSAAMARALINTPFGAFREHAKSVLGCRYGGDFQQIDRPHFDRQILPGGSEAWRHHFYFNQLHFHQIAANVQALPREIVRSGDGDGRRVSSIA